MTSLGWIKAHQELISLISLKPSMRKSTTVEELKGYLGLDKYDINIHFPAAAIPKDGPSAGITITVALISLLTGVKVRNDVSMTGEISLKGAVLPVGGIKEKCLAAYSSGIKKCILPEKNKKDIEEISKEVRKNMRFFFVKHISDAIQIALDTPLSIDDIDNVIKYASSGINAKSKL